MKGIVIAPILAAVLVQMVTGSSAAAATAFWVTCVIGVLALIGYVQQQKKL